MKRLSLEEEEKLIEMYEDLDFRGGSKGNVHVDTDLLMKLDRLGLVEAYPDEQERQYGGTRLGQHYLARITGVTSEECIGGRERTRGDILGEPKTYEEYVVAEHDWGPSQHRKVKKYLGYGDPFFGDGSLEEVDEEQKD